MKTFIKFCIFNCILLGSFCVPCFASSELINIQNQIKQTERQNKQVSELVKNSEREVASTKKQLVTAADKVSSLEEKKAKILNTIQQLDNRKLQLNQELANKQVQVTDSAMAVSFIALHPNFDTNDMHNFILTSALLSGVMDNFDTEIQNINKKLQELEEIRKKREQEIANLEKTSKKYKIEKTQLDKLLKTRSAQNEKLKNRQAQLQQKLKELSARAKSISELSAGVGSSEMSADSRFSRRKMNLPVRGRVSVHFGEQTALGLKSDGWRIRVRTGTLVLAPADGIVKYADTFRGFGRVIIMSHKNGYNTVITNFGSIDVVLEQEVLAGEPIGRTCADKNEIYLEVRRGKSAVDPAKLFKED